MTRQYLDDLEQRIDTEVEERLLSDWQTFLDGRLTSGFFSPRRIRQSPAGISWPEVRTNEALDSFERMAVQQLAVCSGAVANEGGSIMNVRTNYGSAILSSVFGAPVFRMADELNTLPTTRPLEGGVDTIRRLVDKGTPDLNAGFGRQCFEMGRYFVRLFADYPKIRKYVYIYHPDLQGPMDICEVLWGSGLFLDLFDSPDVVHSLLNLITETYIRFLREWEKIVPPQDGPAAHWGMLHKGRIMLRDDSAMNLSPDMFDEFIRPYDQRLLTEFGGGAVHFCGRGDHFIDRLARMNGLYAVNLSQPHLNDMERIFSNTIDIGIPIIGLRKDAAESAVKAGRNLRGRVHAG